MHSVKPDFAAVFQEFVAVFKMIAFFCEAEKILQKSVALVVTMHS